MTLLHTIGNLKNERPRRHSIRMAVLYTLLVTPGFLFAHSGETHDDPGITTNSEQTDAGTTDAGNLPESIANIGGPFSLTNHLGQSVTEQTYAGKHMLIFFGYSNCQIMCSISLKRIADALTILEADTDAPLTKFQPLVITVDPENDTPTKLRENLATYHPALTGLTGTLAELIPVYKAYQQKPSILDMELNASAVVSHSSYFYLMDQNGKLKTLFPPVLSPDSMAKLIKKYLPN